MWAEVLTSAQGTLSEIEPVQANLDWLPIPLSVKHSEGKPASEGFRLNPGEQRGIDFVSAVRWGHKRRAHRCWTQQVIHVRWVT
jgi:hypothetical protein